MMPSCSLALLALGRLLISDVAGVSVTMEGSVMRSERQKKAAMDIELQASGAMVYHQRDAAGVESDMDMCGMDFPLGDEGQCDCANTTLHQLVLEEDECMEAALQAGVGAPVLTFRLNAEWYHYHPKGCFKQPCKLHPTGICYFFNPIGDLPAKCGNTTLPIPPHQPPVQGAPVCSRPRYRNATANTNGDCPEGYGNIMSEKNCSDAAVCLGFTKGTIFDVTNYNQSRHDDFPRGCFVDDWDGKIYYNPDLEGWDYPKKPVGTAMCNVTVRTWFGIAGAGGDASVNMTERAGAASTATTTPAALLDVAASTTPPLF